MSIHVAGDSLDELLLRDWVSTNGTGGYASSTPIGLNTRKYHGLLVAAMNPPVRRMVLLSRLEETLNCQGRSISLATAEYPQSMQISGADHLVMFDHHPFPRWAYQADGWTLQKELRLLPQRNVVLLTYTLLGCCSPATLEVKPLLALRPIHELMYQWNGSLHATHLAPGHLRVDATNRTPEVYLAHDGTFEATPLWYLNNIYRQEQKRGYAALEDLWTPGTIRWTLQPGSTVHFVCSADPLLLEQVVHEAEDEPIRLHTTVDANEAMLLQAATEFTPVVLSASPPIAHLPTQYPWSPPNGRDALIALPGLFLTTGRFTEAANLLESFVAELDGGLMPTVFPEDGSRPTYTGADVSLWFVHAVDRYLHATGESASNHGRWIDAIERIIDAYQHGTGRTASLGIRFGSDSLLCANPAGQATSWMDSKIGDWIVTPRAGRRVEINALWHNALCVAADAMHTLGRTARAEELAMLAANVQASFVRTFWNEQRRCLFDVVADHAIDSSLRPNQLFAVSLPHPVLPKEYQLPVLNAVRQYLLTPFGLRTLETANAAYCGHYAGDVVSRDRAAHQGTVYPWLLGAYADALLRVNGDKPETRSQIATAIAGCITYIKDAGVGQLCELFDGNAPHHSGGAVASAKSVGEILRAYQLAVGPKPALASGETVPVTR